MLLPEALTEKLPRKARFEMQWVSSHSASVCPGGVNTEPLPTFPAPVDEDSDVFPKKVLSVQEILWGHLSESLLSSLKHYYPHIMDGIIKAQRSTVRDLI